MRVGPDISRIAAALGDPARAAMAAALMGGQALTASELALEAGVSRATASSHLARLAGAGLVAVARQGRARYHRIASHEVAATLEALMTVAARGPARARPGPKEPALRRARVCYDHLAGELGVAMLDGLAARGDVAVDGDSAALSAAGRLRLTGLGIDVAGLEARPRTLCRTCLDWSERRPHLAGGLGAALLAHILGAGWAARDPGSRAVAFTARGEAAFRAALAGPPAAGRAPARCH